LVVGGRSFFPDFTLRHQGGFSVLVEVVGFYTPDYLRSKLDALRAAAARPLIACIDESLACADGELAGAVLRFKRRIDAAALIAIAERLREEHRSGAGAAWSGRAG
jgi:predicted nuclease of restriction endonuclease-like RecB superfamily